MKRVWERLAELVADPARRAEFVERERTWLRLLAVACGALVLAAVGERKFKEKKKWK